MSVSGSLVRSSCLGISEHRNDAVLNLLDSASRSLSGSLLLVVGNVIYFIQSDRPGHCGILAGHCSFVSAPTSAFLSVS